MFRGAVAIAVSLSAGAGAAATPTDFGVRALPGERGIVTLETPKATVTRVGGSGRVSVDMSSIASIGSHWGRVTSTYRSAAHNREVGGVPNSFHLRGRAIDIARRAGVSHWQIAAAYRAAGYNLLESLDEGDHSHFAFGNPGEVKYRALRAASAPAKATDQTNWGIVYAPGGGN